jgi:D-amino peptidase
MRVYISCDLEGVCGVVHTEQTYPDGRGYQHAQELMTAEANSAAVGAFKAGAKKVVINDAHGSMINIIIDKLDRRVQLISGSLKPLSMVQGIEDGFDLAFFIGYHAGMGMQSSVLAHTYWGAVVSEVTINGRTMNEAGINALVAGYYNTPVGLITGDDKACLETKRLLGNIETVVVKWGISRYAARALHPKEAQRRIKDAAMRVTKNAKKFKPFKLKPPYILKVRMINTGMADNAERMPGAKRLDPFTIQFSTPDLIQLLKAMETALCLGGVTIPQIRRR